MSSGVRLKVGTYNTHLFVGTPVALKPGMTKEDEARRQAIADRINASDRDIVGLTEVWDSTSSDPFESHCHDKYPFSFWADRSLISEAYEGKGIGCGLHLLSKYPLLDQQFVPYRTLSGEDAMSDKGIAACVVSAPGGMVRLLLTHTQAWPSEEALRARADNLRQLSELVATYQPDLPGVIMGDLNVAGASQEYQSLVAALPGCIDAYASARPGDPGYTSEYENSLNRYFDPKLKPGGDERLDYIFCSGAGARATAAQVIKDYRLPSGLELSDHYPLFADLELPGGGQGRDALVFETLSQARSKAEALKRQYGSGVSAMVVIHNSTRADLVATERYNVAGGFHNGKFSSNYSYPGVVPAGMFGACLHVKPEKVPTGATGALVYRSAALQLDFLLGWQVPWVIPIFGTDNNKAHVEAGPLNQYHGMKADLRPLIEHHSRREWHSPDGRVAMSVQIAEPQESTFITFQIKG